jgi:hypothetical protein
VVHHFRARQAGLLAAHAGMWTSLGRGSIRGSESRVHVNCGGLSHADIKGGQIPSEFLSPIILATDTPY